jgi:NitT/TauT family transport system substrate-binding protein
MVSCSSKDASNKKIVIADQFGLGYAPIQIMKANGYLEENLPDYKIEWVKMGNASAIREAMISGDLDVGFMGIPPFIIGVDNNTPWKIFTGVSESPLGLISRNNEILSLRDIQSSDQIILPQPGSIQHILLQMGAKKEFDNPNIFDDQLLTMNHSDGLSAFTANNELDLHFTSPPYIFKELKLKESSLVLNSKEAFGGSFTFIVGVGQESFFNNQEMYEGFTKSLEKSINFINNDQEHTIKLLSEIYDYSENELEEYIYNKETVYSQQIKGLDKFVNFMSEVNMIDEDFDEILVWEDEGDFE